MKKIDADGAIRKMKRHTVHMLPTEGQARASADRWKRQTPVVLKIDGSAMAAEGYAFGMADNGVWCTEVVPVQYICDRLFTHEGCEQTDQYRGFSWEVLT